ncbi:uncharacterized protein A4U43_C01F25850 [Asparagus officinalis]|uniref:Uncharacterized protein n=1 Tax=Asparagus officinalis TaxID=4686 RepID=A0A5P1FU02_ASPOF|nr:uncharacterized protein A4U43_C01F25850 [Asparagus officinalis]
MIGDVFNATGGSSGLDTPTNVHVAIILRRDCRHVNNIITSVRSQPPKIHQRHEQGDEQNEVIDRVPLAHTLVGPGSERQEVPPEHPVLLLLLAEPIRIEPPRFAKPLEGRFEDRRKDDRALGNRVPVGQREVLRGDCEAPSSAAAGTLTTSRATCSVSSSSVSAGGGDRTSALAVTRSQATSFPHSIQDVGWRIE